MTKADGNTSQAIPNNNLTLGLHLIDGRCVVGTLIRPKEQLKHLTYHDDFKFEKVPVYFMREEGHLTFVQPFELVRHPNAIFLPYLCESYRRSDYHFMHIFPSRHIMHIFKVYSQVENSYAQAVNGWRLQVTQQSKVKEVEKPVITPKAKERKPAKKKVRKPAAARPKVKNPKPRKKTGCKTGRCGAKKKLLDFKSKRSK